jgi:hypothetical protein
VSLLVPTKSVKFLTELALAIAPYMGTSSRPLESSSINNDAEAFIQAK